MGALRFPARTRAAVAVLALLAAAPGGAEDASRLLDPPRMLLGVGDRLTLRAPGEERWIPLADEARRADVPLDLLAVWLPRGWSEDWVKREHLQALARQGVTPVVIHYYFGDDISQQAIEGDRDGWYTSMWRMANLVRMDAPVLVVLEPEWNVRGPADETPVTSWPWFANDLRAAAKMIREEAPNALVGTCPGDFPGTPHLEPVLGPVASDLDFLAFQEMRASTAEEAGRDGYLEVGRAAADYAAYLKRAFGRPLLLAYVAVSSYDADARGRARRTGWEGRQADALRDLGRHREALRRAGVFGALYFQLRDDPAHRGHFGPAERHFGLTRADGSPKPALDAFRSLAR